MENPKPYKCCDCNDYINNIFDHIIKSDHDGILKLGIYAIDANSLKTGYVNVRYPFTYARLRELITNSSKTNSS